MSYQMTEEEFRLLADFIRGYAGLVFTGTQRLLFHKRIKARMDHCKINSAKEYYHFLRFDSMGGDEIKSLMDAVTVNETYFFREEPQMEMLKKCLLPLLREKKAGERTIRIWSAASSTGAEPYSIAIIVKECGLFSGPEWKVEISGTDINGESLQAARKGIYTQFSFRATSPEIRGKHFREIGPGQWEINDDIKRMVKFFHINMYNRTQMKNMRGMDLILCRNALIYFDIPCRKEVAEMFYESLVPEGHLIIGQAESLFKITNLFEIKPMANVLAYRKPSAGFKAGAMAGRDDASREA